MSGQQAGGSTDLPGADPVGTEAEAIRGDTWDTTLWRWARGVLGVSDLHGGSGSSADKVRGAQSAGDSLGLAGPLPAFSGDTQPPPREGHSRGC